MRCLAPAGGFPTPSAVFRSSLDPNLAGVVQQQLKNLFNNQPISLCSSGKQAIEIISRYLLSKGYKRLVLGAYGCPDIVAAVVRGGLKVKLVDLDSKSLEPLFGDHNPVEDILLLSNLYGLVDSVSGLSKFKLIDDACQAALSFDGDLRVGGRGLGVLSFGRGKAFCGVGGGAIIGFGEQADFSSGKFQSLIKLLAYSVLENPALYCIPSAIPFFKLGETKFEPDYRDSKLDLGQLATAERALENLEKETKLRRTIQELWTTSLDQKKVILPLLQRKSQDGESLTRFPILIPENRDNVYLELYKAGVGVSKSYPSTLDLLCSGYVEGDNFEGARKIGSQILTLPTHRFVEQSDIEKAANIIGKYA